MKNLEDQRKPVLETKEYIVTDQCFWEVHPPEDYNIFDPKRTPHGITLVDKVTGSFVILESGSIIKIVKAHKNQ